MTAQDPQHGSNGPGPAVGGDDLSSRLTSLRTCLTEIATDESLQQLVAGVERAVGRMSAEHAGMADELLALYEQLGVVFEVSRSLGAVHTEVDVLDLFLGSLRRSFAPRMVSVSRADPDGRVRGEPFTFGGAAWISELVRSSVREKKVLVAPAPEGSSGPANRLAGVAEAMVGPVRAGESVVCAVAMTRPVQGGQEFRASDMLLLESLSLFCGDLIRNHRLVREMQTMSITMVRALVSAVDQKDTYTSGHSIRVGLYATLLGRAVGLGSEEMTMLQWSALLHDVGKIGIRDDVLKKSGKLTKEEFDHIKEHPVRSFQIVEGIPQLAGALDGVLYHHERMDGSGYPEGLTGEQIPLQARIVQIADIFDALTSNRAYRGAFDYPKALEILQEGSGTTSDPHLLKLFERALIEAIGEAPDGWERLLDQAELFTEAAVTLPSENPES